MKLRRPQLRLLYLSVLLVSAIMLCLLSSCKKAYVLSAQTRNESNKCVIEIKGEIKYSGIYNIEKGLMMFELLEIAGGVTPYADLSSFNLVERLNENQSITIPYSNSGNNAYRLYSISQGSYCFVDLRGEVNQPGIYQIRPNTTLGELLVYAGLKDDSSNIDKSYIITENELIIINNGKTNVTAKININTATLEELQTLSKIGPAIAQKIIEYRTSVGRFKNITEIMNVKGIGEDIYQANKEHITV